MWPKMSLGSSGSTQSVSISAKVEVIVRQVLASQSLFHMGNYKGHLECFSGYSRAVWSMLNSSDY